MSKSKGYQTALRYMNALAGGVVLGALLLHMIPELFHGGHHSHGGHSHDAIISTGQQDDHIHGQHHHHHRSKPETVHEHEPDHSHSDAEGVPEHENEEVEHTEKGSKNKKQTDNSSFFSLNEHYSWGCLVAGCVFLLLFYVDRIFFGQQPHEECNMLDPETGKDDKKDQKKDKDSCCSGHSHDQHHHHHHHKSVSGQVHSNPKQLTIQLNTNHSQSRIISIEKHQPEKPPQLNQPHGLQHSCHSHDLVGGCHMDSITSSSSQSQTMIFIIALSLHSFLEGLGAAGQPDASGLFQFALSLVGHKLLEAFALGVSVMRANFTRSRSIAVVGAYSGLTPAGILIGMVALRAAGKRTAIVVEVLNGAAIGSFMFVGLIEMIPPEFHTYDPKHTKGKFGVLCLGFALMALVNALGHKH